MFNPAKAKKARKGFSLVELVIAILIIAVLVAAVFAGGSIIIRNSQISRTESDLHNFSIAMETVLNENPYVANIKADGTYDYPQYIATLGADNAITKEGKLVTALNKLLAEDYKLKTDKVAVTDSHQYRVMNPGEASTGYVILESKKTDAWGNPYFVVLDYTDKHDGVSEFYITVVSAGPDGQTTIGTTNTDYNKDDVICVAQYSDGSVASGIYNKADANLWELIGNYAYAGNANGAGSTATTVFNVTKVA